MVSKKNKNSVSTEATSDTASAENTNLSKATNYALPTPSIVLSKNLADQWYASATTAKSGLFTATVKGKTNGVISATISSSKGNVTINKTWNNQPVTFALTATHLTALGDGMVIINVTYKPSSSSALSPSSSIYLELDTTPPVKPTISVSDTLKSQKGFLNASNAASFETMTASITGGYGDKITTTFKSTAKTITKTDYAFGSNIDLALTGTEIKSLGQGNVTFTTIASDDAGNTSSNSGSFKIDTIAPSAPTLALSTAVIGANNTATPDIAKTGAFTLKGVAGDKITTTLTGVSGSLILTQNATGAAVPITLTAAQVAALGEGLISVKSTSTDTAGNTSAASNSQFKIQGSTGGQPSNSTISRIDIYGTATDLAPYLRLNFAAIERSLLTSKNNLEVNLLWDQSLFETFATGKNTQSPWSTLGTAILEAHTVDADPVIRYESDLYINDDVNLDIQTKFTLLPEQDTGDSVNFKNFLINSVNAGTKTPANRTLMMNNHGGGVLYGVNSDGNDNQPFTGSGIAVPDFLRALSDANAVGRYDVIAFDECLMGSIEVAFELKNYTKYMVASQESVGGLGYDYYAALSKISKPLTGLALGNRFVDTFRSAYGSTPEIGVKNTLSVTDLSKMANVSTKIKSFVDNMVAVQSPAFWSSVGDAMQRGTYYDFSIYQDLTNFVARVSRLADAPVAVINAAGDLLDSLGQAIVNNTIQSNGTTLLPKRGMNPVDAASFGLSVLLPYNKSALDEFSYGASMESFIRNTYAPMAQNFIAATGWDKLLLALDSNNAIKSGANPLLKSEGRGSRPKSSTVGTTVLPSDIFPFLKESGTAPTPSVTTDSTTQKFFIDFANYASNLTGNPLEYAVTNSLGFLTNASVPKEKRILLNNLSFTIDPISPERTPLKIELIDTKTNSVLATKTSYADSSISFNPVEIKSTLANMELSSTHALRVSTTDEEGVGFSVVANLKGRPAYVSPNGLTKGSANILNSLNTIQPNEFLDKSHPTRYYVFQSGKVKSPIAIEGLSVGDEEYKITITENPGTNKSKTITRSGSYIVGQYFQPAPATPYLIEVSKANKTNNITVDMVFSATPQIDPNEGQDFKPAVLTLGQSFSNQGTISVRPAKAGEANIFANVFVDDAEIGTLSALATGAKKPSATFQTTSAAATNALNRNSVADLTDFSTPSDFVSILNGAFGKSIGNGASIKMPIENLQAGFELATNDGFANYKSTGTDVVTTNYETDTCVTFGNGSTVSIDAGVYDLPTNGHPYTIHYTAANGHSLASNQKDTFFFYNVDSVSGDIRKDSNTILHPGDKGYAAAAINRGKNTMKSFSTQTGSLGSALLEGDLIAMGIIVNGDRSTFLTKNPSNRTDNAFANAPHAYFSVAGANPDGLSHLISLGNSTYAFEDSYGKTSNDFADFMVRFQGSDA